MKEKQLPEFMIRVRLPSPDGYPSCPSGDTDYEEDYKEAIKRMYLKDLKLLRRD
jgi:hypothetical protein